MQSTDFAAYALNDAALGSSGLAPITARSSESAPTDQPIDHETQPLTREAKGKGKDTTASTEPTTATHAAQAFFSRLQASLPSTNNTTSLPSLASFQSTLSSHLSSNPNLQLDLPALRQTLTTNFQKLQTDLHLADAEHLAEEYLRKSEAVLREAGAAAGSFLQEAVKVVPPPQSSGGMSWDGSDVWTLPAPSSQLGSSKIIFAQSDAQISALTGLSPSSVRAQRKDALLKQLRSDRALIKLDPSGGQGVDEDVTEAWNKWFATEVEAKGGIDGDEWTAKVWGELGPGGEGVEELKAMRDELGWCF